MKPVKIGKYEIKYPIIQGGMGLGISWDGLASAVTNAGGLGCISTVGTGYYKDKEFIDNISFGRPAEAENFCNKDALKEIFKAAREKCGDKPLAANVMYAISEYERVIKETCEAGADILICGAGLPTNMPEFTADYPDIALVPIVSSAKALKIICSRWKKRYNKLPDAVVLEGPLSGGHQGFKYEDCYKEEFQLETLLPQVIEEAKKWADHMPIFVAGGVWDKKDIDKFIEMGAAGVQMATRFIGTHECDASDNFKDVLLKSKKEDIKLLKSPVGYPARGIQTNLIDLVDKKEGPAIKCISNCVFPCKRGIEAKEVGFCIADRLADAWMGNRDFGLFFTGENGYKLDEIISVEELMQKLINGED